jgi:hypothetical protein
VDDYRVPDQQPRHVANALSHRIACLGRAGHDVPGTASAVQLGLHAPALLYNIIPGISLLYNNGFPIIMGHKIHVILGVF